MAVTPGRSERIVGDGGGFASISGAIVVVAGDHPSKLGHGFQPGRVQSGRLIFPAASNTDMARQPPVTRDPSDHSLALLIDADNAQAAIVEALLAEASRYGTANVKRAYGDWTTPQMSCWKAHLHQHAIQPVQQFRYTQGKNATDSALIIDAMDLLHVGDLNGFCLVSSDSDFTRLATRIRESGLMVYGFGEEKTPAAFVAACDRFIYTETLAHSNGKAEITRLLEPLIRNAVTSAAGDDGWAGLSAVGNAIYKQHPSFDSRICGFPKLGELFRSLSYIETREVPSPEGIPSGQLDVRIC